MCKSLSACCAVVGHTLAPANSSGCEQEYNINKSFHSVWVPDVTTAPMCIAQVQMDLQDAAAWGQGMPRLKSLILLLKLCSVWAGCQSGVFFLFTHRGFWSALLRCELGTPVCVMLVWTGQTQLGNTLCSVLGAATRVRNKSEPFVILVRDQGPGPKIRGQSSSACGLQCWTNSWAWLLHSNTSGSSFKCVWKQENGALLVLCGSWAEDVGKQDQIYSSCYAEQKQVLFPSVPATSLWPGQRVFVLEKV